MTIRLKLPPWWPVLRGVLIEAAICITLGMMPTGAVMAKKHLDAIEASLDKPRRDGEDSMKTIAHEAQRRQARGDR